MGKTSITGIGGVLGGLISEPRVAADDELPSSSRCSSRSATTAKSNEVQRSEHEAIARAARTHARTGRPPGKENSSPTRKEKLTVRIDADLAAAYRDWSWDARCNLGELVSRAMRNHLSTGRDS